jgi:hypothetical protein
MINATWQAEALFPLLWALGIVQELPPATALCDLPSIRTVLPPLFGSTSEFISQAALRSLDQIMEAYEDTYQAHWLVRDADISEKPVPRGLNREILQERHHALNWLVSSSNQAWDDVTTDT